MIIAALAAAAEHLSIPPQGYQQKATPWALTLSPHGETVSLVPLEVTDANGRTVPVRQPVPKVTRTVRVAPQLVCDTGIYTLGLAKPPPASTDPYAADAPASRDVECHQAWVQLIRDWDAAVPSGEPAAAAILAWVDAGMPRLNDCLPTSDKDLRSLADGNVAIYIQDEATPVHLQDSAVRFWQAHVNRDKSSRSGLCSSCGTEQPLVDSFPSGLPRRLVPGASQATVALTSANFPTMSRSLRVTQLKNAQVCVTCAMASVAALTALADDRGHTWISDDARTAWWLRSGTAPSIFDWLDDTPSAGDVARILDQLRAGQPVPEVGDLDDHYYALTFSGHEARVVIHSWIDMTLGAIAAAIGDYFADSAVASPDDPQRLWEPMWRIAKSAGARRVSAGKVITDAPHGSHEALLRAALTGGPVAPSLLARVTARSRAEIPLQRDSYFEWRDREHARVCLIRMILTRGPHLTGGATVPGPTLDPTNADPAYQCGRLFAEYEGLQRTALGDLNATITDRAYSKAMMSPQMIYPSLDRLSKAHLRKLRSGHRDSAAFAIEQKITELVSTIGLLPAALDVPAQARWMLGYYQQRAANYATARATTAANADTGTSEAADRSAQARPPSTR